jgi:hypothetical protein
MKQKTLKEINGALTLVVDDTPLQCAIIPPLLVPGRLAGTAEYQVRPCCELCPLFKVTIENDTDDYGEPIDPPVIKNTLILCHTNYYDITIKTNENQPKSSIFTLNNENKAF